MPANFLVSTAAGTVSILDGTLKLSVGFSLRLHTRVHPGDVIWFMDYKWPRWLVGHMTVLQIDKGYRSVMVAGQAESSRWFPESKIGIGVALRLDTERPPVRMTPAFQREWTTLLAQAPEGEACCWCQP